MQVTIRLPDEQMGRISRIARELGLKKSDITRMAINRFLKEYDEGEAAAPFDKVKHLLGAVESGVSDLGQRHRSHLMAKIKAHSE